MTKQESKYMQDEILERAKTFAQEWIDAIRFDGKYDREVILDTLSKRTGPTGNQCIVRLVDSPTKVQAALRDALFEAEQGGLIAPYEGKTLAQTKAAIVESFGEANRCVWDYYLMAFYESAMNAAEHSHYFTDQSFLPAFRAGLGYVINYGDVLIGIVLPEAHFDNRDNLHSETQAALSWGDSVNEFWWHGTEVEPDWIVNKESVDPSLALTWQNIEQRRALCEILSWEKVISSLKPKVIDKDPNPQIGTLLEVDLPDSEGARFLRVKCGTGRDFCMPVPTYVDSSGQPTEKGRGAKHLNTALKANAWTYDLPPEVLLKLKVRT